MNQQRCKHGRLHLCEQCDEELQASLLLEGQTAAPGDTAHVHLPDGWHTGRVAEVKTDWDGETMIHVRGDKPQRFITTTKLKFARIEQTEGAA